MKRTNKYFKDIQQHINFLDQTIQKPSICDYARQELSQQLQRVKQRYADSNFYLAIVGEFSSGKSTFINALLRDNILETSTLVATATATKITYADSFRAKALFKKARPEQFIKKTEEKSQKDVKNSTITLLPGFVTELASTINTVIAKRLKQNSNAIREANKFVTSKEALELGISKKQFVQMVTSSEELARKLDSFQMYHPASFLKNGIVIIDTPGTNAQNEAHGKITEGVVGTEADAAVIIIPANQPVSDTLINFLSGQLYQYIHRCVFVVTKMDNIRPREQSRLIKTIQKRLTEKLNIEQLLLLETAPQIVLNLITGEESVSEQQKHWNNDFIEVEKKIQEHLASSREIAIAESIQRLLTQVFRQSESHLKQQQQQFRQEQHALEVEIIKDLSSFTNEQYSECSVMIQNATYEVKYQVTKLVRSCQEASQNKLHNLIFSTTNKDELKTTLENKVSPLFDDARSTLDQKIKTTTEELNQSFAQVKIHFDHKFAKQYENLKTLSTRVNVSQQTGNNNTIQVSNSGLISVVSELSKAADDSSNIQIGFSAGVGTGAVIGTMIFPGVGTFVGAVIGSLLGSIFGGLFDPSLEELKINSWNELNPKLQDYFDSAEKVVIKSLESYSQQINNALNQHIDIYIQTYQKIVEAMQKEQKSKKAKLFQLQQDIEADLLEINTRLNSLKQSKTSLVHNR